MSLKDYSDADIETEYGHFNIRAYRNGNGEPETVVLIHRENDAEPETMPVVRIHSECLTGDIFSSMHCDCRAQADGVPENNRLLKLWHPDISSSGGQGHWAL